MCYVLFDCLLVYSMSDQGTSNAYHHLDSSKKNEGTSSQPDPSGYSAYTEERIFIFKAQSEEPFTTKKRLWFYRGDHERRIRMKKLKQQRAIVRANREVDAQIYEVTSRPPSQKKN
ncbi:hypothetical protein Hanom_Chr03g00207671 [Helianthus anomalus]